MFGQIRNPELIWMQATRAVLAGLVVAAAGGCSNPDALTSEGTENEQVSDDLRVGLTMLEVTGQKLLQAETKKLQDSSSTSETVKAAMRGVLFDPRSAEYENVRRGREGSICGKINGKNRMGAYIGYKDFVVTSTKEVLISTTNDGIAFSGSTPFAVAYAKACASTAEAKSFYASNAPEEESEPSAPSLTEPELVPDEPDAILDAPPRADDVQKERQPVT